MGRTHTIPGFRFVGGVLVCLACSLHAPWAEEFWCEGLDDDGDGETDEGCERTCVEPFALGAPVSIAPSAVATTSISLIRPGTGLALAYADSRSGISQVYVQTTATSGTPDLAEVRISNGVNPAYSPSLVWTGIAYGVVWVDERSGNPEVYFRVLRPDLTPASADIAVSATSTPSLNPVIVWTAGVFAVAWDDAQGGNRDIYFRRFNALGMPLGQAVSVTTNSAIQEQVSLAWDSTQFALAWTDERDGNREIYTRRLGATGTPVGGEVRITSASGSSERASLKVLKSGDFGLAWHDGRSGTDTAWYGRWQGPGYGAPPGTAVSAGTGASRKPSLTTTGAEVLVTWEDLRHGGGEVYLRRLDADGVSLSPELRLTTGAGASSPSAHWHGGGVAVAYSGTDGGATARASLVLAGCGGADPDADGFLTSQGDCNDATTSQHPSAVEGCDALDNDCDGARDDGCRGTCRANLPTPPQDIFPGTPVAADWPVIVWDGQGYGVAWQERELVPGCCFIAGVYFRRLDGGGAPLTTAIRLTPSGLGGENATLVWTGSEYGVAWEQYDLATFVRRIAFLRVDASGVPVGSVREVTRDPMGPVGHYQPIMDWRQDEYGLVFEDLGAMKFVRLDRAGRPVERPRDVSPSYGSALGYVAADSGGYALVYAFGEDPFFRGLDRFGGFRGAPVQLKADVFNQGFPRVEVTPWGYGVFWVEHDGFDVGKAFYQKLDSSGTPQGSPVKFNPQADSTMNAVPPRLIWVGSEFLFCYREGLPDKIMIARLDENGSRLAPDVSVEGDPADSFVHGGPEMAWNGVRPAIVWGDTRVAGLDHSHNLISLLTCCEEVAVPPLVQGLSWTAPTVLAWTSNGAERYDRVRGDLNLLLNGAGNWSSTVVDCQNDLSSATSNESATPASSAGFYYLVRSDSVCWAGSYDEGGAQQGSPDAGINSSPNACP